MTKQQPAEAAVTAALKNVGQQDLAALKSIERAIELIRRELINLKADAEADHNGKADPLRDLFHPDAPLPRWRTVSLEVVTGHVNAIETAIRPMIFRAIGQNDPNAR